MDRSFLHPSFSFLDIHPSFMDIHLPKVESFFVDIHPPKVDVHAGWVDVHSWGCEHLGPRIVLRAPVGGVVPVRYGWHRTRRPYTMCPKYPYGHVGTRLSPAKRRYSSQGEASAGGSVKGDGPHGPWSRASGRSGTSPSILTDDLSRITPPLSLCCDTACEPPGCRVGACSLASDSPPRSDVPLPPS